MPETSSPKALQENAGIAEKRGSGGDETAASGGISGGLPPTPNASVEPPTPSKVIAGAMIAEKHDGGAADASADGSVDGTWDAARNLSMLPEGGGQTPTPLRRTARSTTGCSSCCAGADTTTKKWRLPVMPCL